MRQDWNLQRFAGGGPLAETAPDAETAAAADAGEPAPSSEPAGPDSRRELEELRAEVERLRAERERERLGQTAAGLLRERQLNDAPEVLELVLGADEEQTRARVELLERVVQARLQAEERSRTAGRTPRATGGTHQTVSELERRIAKYTQKG